jgi:hypothetical protein
MEAGGIDYPILTKFAIGDSLLSSEGAGLWA